jgi:hypothetical protein
MKWKRINKRIARELWYEGVPITFVGNRVNTFHIFKGWHLGWTTDIEHEWMGDFDENVRRFEQGLEPELGNRAAYLAPVEAIKSHIPWSRISKELKKFTRRQ